MHTTDWIVIAIYTVGIMALGLYYTRKASRGAEAYLVADRKLRWWVIGVSDVASADGADAFWVYAIFSGAFIAFYRIWWIGFVVALPLGILWARYWRRLALLSPGQLYEERYSGRAAGLFRGFFAVYAALFSSVIILSYVLRGFAQIMEPFLGWSSDTVLLVFAGASMLYTMASGLMGVSYSDVPQFILIMIGRVVLAVVVVSAVGGMTHILDTVEAARGADFMQPFPPSTADIYGDFSVDPMSFLALVIAGIFGVAGTSSVGVQRSLAARSELDAALGQLLNAVLTLVVRMLPLLFIGMAGLCLYHESYSGTEVWADIVMEHAFPGLLGLILVGVVAGYMSTIDTYLNFLVAGLFNDFYLRHVRPEAKEREQVLFCRIATVVVTIVAYLWAFVLVGKVDGTWLNFINSVIGLFVLPLTLLRWIWWRVTIWSEIIGFIGAFPLAYLVWFVFDFKDDPYWMSFLVLFGMGITFIILVTFFTKPEDPEVLERFYRKVRPPGFWGPIADKVLGAEARIARRKALTLEIFGAAVGVGFCATLVVGTSSAFSRDWGLMAAMIVCAALSGWVFVYLTIHRPHNEAERASEEGL